MGPVSPIRGKQKTTKKNRLVDDSCICGVVGGYGEERGQAVGVENLEGAIVVPDEEEVEVGGEGHVDVGVAGDVGGHDVVVQELGE